jgi:hypothetical protein
MAYRYCFKCFPCLFKTKIQMMFLLASLKTLTLKIVPNAASKFSFGFPSLSFGQYSPVYIHGPLEWLVCLVTLLGTKITCDSSTLPLMNLSNSLLQSTFYSSLSGQHFSWLLIVMLLLKDFCFSLSTRPGMIRIILNLTLLSMYS